MDDDLENRARQANDLMRSRANGLVECRVQSHEPPVLGFQFAGPMEAHMFLVMRQADRSSRFKYAMAPERVDMVLEYR